MNIAYSCHLLDYHMDKITLNASSKVSSISLYYSTLVVIIFTIFFSLTLMILTWAIAQLKIISSENLL